MEIILIGLGKMGLNIALQLKNKKKQLSVYDINAERLALAKQQQLTILSDLTQLQQNKEKKIVWLMLPAGPITQSMIEQMADLLQPGDYLIDGGNSYYKDSMKNAAMLAKKDIHFIDIGTSGGTDGALNGACLMVGCSNEVFQVIQPILQDLAVENGLLHAGPSGSGHYLKMVHNGIEYGMMQAIGEGFEILHNGAFNFDLEQVAKTWNHGSVIRSWLMELTQDAFKHNGNLETITGQVPASGEGQWTVEEALQLEIPTPIISLSLMMRNRSMQESSYSGKVVAALRNGFGSHDILEQETVQK